MITTVDVPAPGPLRRRWAGLAAALAELGHEPPGRRVPAAPTTTSTASLNSEVAYRPA